MAGRSGRRGIDHCSPLVDLELVFADDEYIDGIADSPWGAPPRPMFAGSAAVGCLPAVRGGVLTADPLTDLFQSWRTELSVVPLPAPPPVRRAAEAVEKGRVRRRRSLKPMFAVAAAIAALLVGSATVGSKNATPDSVLWGITQVMWPDRALSVESVGHVNSALKDAQAWLDAGQTSEAQLAVLRATTELGKVDDVDGRQELQNKVSDMWRKAAPAELADTSPFTRPSASAPVTAPGAPSWTSPTSALTDPSVVTVAPDVQAPANAANTANTANTTNAANAGAPASSVPAPSDPPTVDKPAGGGVLAAAPVGTGGSAAAVNGSPSVPTAVVSDPPTVPTVADPLPPPVGASVPSTVPEPVIPVGPPPVVTPTDPPTASTAELVQPVPTPSLPPTSGDQTTPATTSPATTSSVSSVQDSVDGGTTVKASVAGPPAVPAA